MAWASLPLKALAFLERATAARSRLPIFFSSRSYPTTSPSGDLIAFTRLLPSAILSFFCATYWLMASSWVVRSGGGAMRPLTMGCGSEANNGCPSDSEVASDIASA